MTEIRAGLPEGTVTFLFTDLEDSTGLVVALGDRYGTYLTEHRTLIRTAAALHNATELQTEGDSFLFVFGRPSEAVKAALDAQLAMQGHAWPEGRAFRARMGIHTGEAALIGDDYVGLAIHQAQRVSSVAHGGQVLVSAASRAVAGGGLPHDARLRSIGRVRLKGIDEPDELFQLEHPGLQSSFPPPRVIGLVPHNLPPTLSSFVGRTSELATLSDALSASRLVTVTGPGGVGKTRLAIEAARSAAPSFEAGIWLVDLAAVADGSLVPGAVLSTLGADRRPEGAGASSDTTDEDGALARLAMRLSHRPALILLDNCEHVITACARVASRLLTASDGAHILATSREPLAIDGEAVFPLDPMPLGDPSSGAESLFVERARRHDVSFEPDAPEAIGEICRLTDGLPLAIELAAAHVRALSCQEIARRLGSDRFTLLRSGSRTAADRQRTLEAAVDWGYELLSEPEQMLLPRLAVFPSDFTLEAAEAVCSGDGLEAAGILDLLSGLVDRSFVTRTVRAGRTRYWMLETIRQYGWRRVEASDAVTPRRVLFRKEGDTWAIGPADRPVRLRDGKGLRHVAVLLSAPGREHHVLDLQGAPAALDRDAGEMLDPSARAAYKARIIELGEEAEDALALNDLDRASQATAERDRLLEELARATGLGGRSRRVGSGAERARAAVTKAIRRAIADIAEHDRELGEHLSRAVSTGTFCRYEGGMEWTL